AFAFDQNPGAHYTEAFKQEALVLLGGTFIQPDGSRDFLGSQTLGRSLYLPTRLGVEAPGDVRHLRERVEGLRRVIAEHRHAGVSAKAIVSVSAQDRSSLRGSTLVLDGL